MDKYYYFVSQLPVLYFEREAPLDSDRYLHEAGKWLSPMDYSVLAAVNMQEVDRTGVRNKVLRDYQKFEFSLRDDIARWRSGQKSGGEYKPAMFPASLIKEGNPLQIEVKLLRVRWNYIDEVERDHHFDLEFLVLYFLKLQILQKLTTFNKERGLQTFKNLCEVEV